MEYGREQEHPVDVENVVAHLAAAAAAIRNGELPQETVDEISDAAVGIIEAVNESHGVPPTLEIFGPEEEFKRKIITFFELAKTYSVDEIKKHIFGTKEVEKSVHESLMATLHDLCEQGRIGQYSGLYMSVDTRRIIRKVIHETKQKQADKLARAPNPPKERKPEPSIEDKIRAARLGAPAIRGISTPNKHRNGKK